MEPTAPVHRESSGEGRDAPRPLQVAGDDPAAPSSPLDRSLTGDLPCVACGYSLRGLSIRSNCPECGTSVRAAILAVVDPHASELQPIRRPGLVAAGLIVWTGAALIAAILAWVPQLVELGSSALRARPEHLDLSRPIVLFILLSGLGALAIVRPHAGLDRRFIAAAALGVSAYLPLAWVMWWLGHIANTGALTDYLRGVIADPMTTTLRIAADGLIIVIVLSLRHNARVLVARSLALRQGRVDRQTLAAIAVAAGVGLAGDLLGLLAADSSGKIGEVPALVALGLVATGSALLTLGLAGALIDSVRITRSLRMPAPTLRELVASHTAKPAKGSGGGGGSGGDQGVRR